jgi:hypothetical protein
MDYAGILALVALLYFLVAHAGLDRRIAEEAERSACVVFGAPPDCAFYSGA